MDITPLFPEPTELTVLEEIRDTLKDFLTDILHSVEDIGQDVRAIRNRIEEDQ